MLSCMVNRLGHAGEGVDHRWFTLTRFPVVPLGDKRECATRVLVFFLTDTDT